MRYVILLLLITNKLISQISVAPSSAIPCDSLYSRANFTITSGIAPYTFAVSTPSCSSNYTLNNLSANPSFTMPCAGVYTFTVKDAVNALIGTVMHTVTTNTSILIPVDCAVTGCDTICNGTSLVLLIDDMPFYFTLTSILWSDNETSHAATVSPTITTTYSVNALYTLTSSSKTCSASGSKKIVVNQCTNGIEEYNIFNSISVYPNPVKDKLYLNNNGIEALQININNTLGQIVYSTKSPENQIDFSFLQSGIYYLKVEGGSGQKVFKVVRE
ncbi:MAG: T9SS type A sorting domain-containing protein [Bacteroidia bacterium]